MLRFASLVALVLAPLSAAAQDDKAADKAAEEALDKFKEAYKSKNAEERAAAVFNLSKTEHPRILNKLGQLLLADMDTVRIAAANGLAEAKEKSNKPKAAAHLLAAIGPNAAAKDGNVVTAIYAALGKLREEAALPAVHGAFEHKDVAQAKAAIECAGNIRSRNSIEPLLKLADEYDPKGNKNSNKKPGGTGVPGGSGLPGAGGGGVSAGGVNVPGGGGTDPKTKRSKETFPTIMKALQTITKEKWSTAEEWGIWWERKKATFKVAD